MHSPRSEVRLWLADGEQWRQTWPPTRPASGEPTVDVPASTTASPVGELAVEVIRGTCRHADRELLDRLAGPAGLALANVRLTYELRDALARPPRWPSRLRRSRQRLLDARAQRRRFAAASTSGCEPAAAGRAALERLAKGDIGGLAEARTRGQRGAGGPARPRHRGLPARAGRGRPAARLEHLCRRCDSRVRIRSADIIAETARR